MGDGPYETPARRPLARLGEPGLGLESRGLRPAATRTPCGAQGELRPERGGGAAKACPCPQALVRGAPRKRRVGGWPRVGVGEAAGEPVDITPSQWRVLVHMGRGASVCQNVSRREARSLFTALLACTSGRVWPGPLCTRRCPLGLIARPWCLAFGCAQQWGPTAQDQPSSRGVFPQEGLGPVVSPASSPPPSLWQ